MTAPGAVPEGTTVEQLAAALRAYADVQPERAAIELLIGHNRDGHWLSRRPFRRRVSWFPADDETDEPMAEVDWDALKVKVNERREELVDTGSEVAVLAVACSIARGALEQSATSCDVHNRGLIAVAVVDALGLSWGDVMTAAQS